MDSVILYTAADGGLAIVRPVAAPEPGEAAATFLARLAAIAVPADALDMRVVPADAVPADRRFRAAWQLGAEGAVAIDMGLARAVQLARIRAARDRRLAALDGPMLRALDQGDTATIEALKARRQALRDLPETLAPSIHAAGDPAALAAIWPPELEETDP
jgi:hypothetical protein